MRTNAHKSRNFGGHRYLIPPLQIWGTCHPSPSGIDAVETDLCTVRLTVHYVILMLHFYERIK